MKIAVFWDVAPCSLAEVLPTFQRCLLSPSSGAKSDSDAIKCSSPKIVFSGGICVPALEIPDTT
jgi:hypothetical protein